MTIPIAEKSHSNNPTLTEAFRRVYFLDQALPMANPEGLSHLESFTLSVIASGMPEDTITESRREGLLTSIDDYNDYLEKGIDGLNFGPDFVDHLISHRLENARIMGSIALPRIVEDQLMIIRAEENTAREVSELFGVHAPSILSFMSEIQSRPSGPAEQ